MGPLTPPGTYQNESTNREQNKKVTLIVHENLEFNFLADNIVLEGIEPGLQHTREILVFKQGKYCRNYSGNKAQYLNGYGSHLP